MRDGWGEGLLQDEVAVAGEDGAEGGGEGILDALEFAVDFGVAGLGLGGLGAVEGDELLGEVMDGDVFAGLEAPAPEGLEGGAVGGAFGDFEGDDLGIEDIGHDLAPEFGLGASAGGADLGGLDAELGEAAEAVVHAEGDAFHGGAAVMAGAEGARVDTDHGAGAIGHVGGAFAFEVGQKEEAVGAWGDGGGFSFELGMGVAEVFAHHFGGDRDIHGTEEGQPAVGGVAEGGDFAVGVDDGLFGAGVDGAAGAEAGGDDAWGGIAGADGAHHVVAAAGADEDAWGEAEGGGGGGLEGAGGLVTGDEFREEGWEAVVDSEEGGGGPAAAADVEEGGAGGVAEFHGELAGEPEVEVVVGEEDGGEALEVGGFVAFEPEDFGGGEAWEDGEALGFDGGFLAAEFAHDFLAFGGGGGIAPEFGGADDVPLGVEGDEAVLLAADADGFDFGGLGLSGAEGGADGFGGGVAPGMGVLFFGAWGEVGEEVVADGSGAFDFAGEGVDDEGFGGLGAAIDAD